MQVSFPTSRFSLRRSGKSRPGSRDKTHDESPSSPDILRPSSSAELPTSSPASPGTTDLAAVRPALTRLHSSGSIRRANPARSRAAHPDDLDLRFDLDAQPSDDEDPNPNETPLPAGSWDDEIEHPTDDTLPVASQWGTLADDFSAYARSQRTLSPQEESFPGSALAPLTEEEMDEVEPPGKPFQGLSDYPLDLGKSRRLIDDDYLKSAFGITMSRRESEEQIRRDRMSGKHDSIPAVPPLPTSDVMASPRSEKSEFFEMDVPLTLDPRVLLPPSDSDGENYHLAPHLESFASDMRDEDSDEPESTTSSASTLKQARLAQQLHGDSATAVAIISPDQVLESPKPRRPFSTVSIEGMTNPQSKKASPDQPLKSAASNSSEETNGQDVQSSEHSTGSSVSSAASPPVGAKAAEPEPRDEQRYLAASADDPPTPTDSDDPVTPMAPTDALSPMGEIDDTTSMYHTALTPRRHSKSAASLKRPAARLEARRQNSDASLKTSYINATMNVNKPLPPEPGRRLGSLSHISEQSNESLASSATIRPEHQQHQRSRTTGDIGSPPQLSRAPTNGQRVDSRGSTLSGWSLRSKYSPKDLDALDNAFVQRDGPKGRSQQAHASPVQASTRLMNQSQLALHDSHLDVIREASPPVHRPMEEGPRYHKASLSDPSQRSRPPARTASGRRAVPPASSKTSPRKTSLISLYNDKGPPRPRLANNLSQSSSQVGGQEKSNEEPHRKTTLMIVSPSNKANRVLGKAPTDHKWAPSGSPEAQPATSTQPSSAHSMSSRDHFRSPVERPVDAHFAEIQERMQLLHPKEATQEHLTADGPMNLNEYPGTHGRRNRLTPLAELPAQRSPQLGEPQPTNFQYRRQQGSQTAQFVPPPPPPPPLSESPPLMVDRRGRVDGVDPTSSFSRSTPSQRSTKARSIASLVASEIPDIYACLPSNATNSLRPSMTAEEAEQMISAEAAERVLYRILQHLHNFRDLFAAAQVSRGFYRTFKRHELSLLKSALYRMSPPAWELREISIPRLELLEDGTDYMPNLYFSHYMRDIATLNELKALSLEHCQPFLRTETVQELSAGPDRQTKIDAAFWRVWTFCKVFGVGSQREHDMIGQMDWLKGGRLARQSFQQRRAALVDDAGRRSVLLNPPVGFSEGNGHGLTPDELYDMTEVWTCLGALVRGYLDQLDLAWEFGVFARVNISRGDDVRENALLEEWTHYLMTRGPQAVLRAAAPTVATPDHYARVKADGLTDWRPLSNGSSRSMFLKEALSHVYDEQMRQTRPLMAASPKGFSDLPQVVSPGVVPTFPLSVVERNSGLLNSPSAARMMNMDPVYGRTGLAATAGPMSAPINVPPMVPLVPPMHPPMSGPRSAPMSNFQETLSKLEAIDTSGSASKKGSRLGGRRRAKTGENPEQRAQRLNVEAILAPASPTDSGSPITPSPGANTFKAQNKGARLANLKSKVTGRSPHTPTSAGGPKNAFGLKTSQVSLPSMPSIDDVSINTQSETLASRGSADQIEDPVAPMIDQLVAMGFEEPKARKALSKNTRDNFIDFEQALASLVKQREIRKKMERLDRMG